MAARTLGREMRKPRREVVLLLPVALEQFAERDAVRALLDAERVAVVEPGRRSGAGPRMVRRLRRRLPRDVRAVVCVDEAQRVLARALAAAMPGAEARYCPPGELGRLAASGAHAGLDAAQDVGDVERELLDGA